MRRFPLTIERSFLYSKVARRIFILFVLCALLPLSALAYIAYSQVTTQLQRQADQRLHQENKVAGMTVFERLLVLETDLKLIMTSLQVANESGFQGGSSRAELCPFIVACGRLILADYLGFFE